MYFGVDYYPEHWEIELIDSDIKRMKEMGVNIVRIGEFAWHLMEKEEGKYDFNFFDMVIEKLKRANIKIMFGTPTATFPAWLAKKYPSILSKDENMQERVFGGRRQYCYNSDIYLEYSNKIVTKLVEHYKNEEAIISWQIDNEFGHEGSDMCYCENCQIKFKKYLKEKYKTPENLNEIYGTIFWGQTYNSFDEIPTPLKTITVHNPSLLLDWSRFRSYSLNGYANAQIELVKKLKGKHQTVTTNLSGGFFTKYYDHEENVKNLDFASYDNYPVWGGLKEPLSPAAIAAAHDFVRGLKDKNFWIVEELMGAQGHNIIGYLPRPNQAKMWSYQAFAHGCENMLWFRWRGMTRGAEQFCFGIIDHDNKDGRKYKEVKEVIEDVSKYEKVIQSKINADIAVVYDFDNIWSWKIQQQSLEFDFNNEIMRLYTPFYIFNTKIDVIPTTKDFDRYKVLVLPVMQIIDDELKEKLDKFSENGGTIIFSFRAGIKDKNNNIHFEETLPCKVREMCGIKIEEVEALQAGQEVEIKSLLDNNIGKCGVWRDLIIPVTATPIYKYIDKFYNDKVCITVNNYKKGKVYYIGGGVDIEVIVKIFKNIIDENNIKHYISEYGLEVYPREIDDEEYLFITNHTDQVKIFENIEIEPYGSKIIKRK
ncbi:beta-galactosidase [Hypnocyclicus thermotrophus]|uniref:Beta-galactosidase n=1 Tax=Hypnocyclicus thermotrophus TaxID=1627895 RepID=A0AA46DY40_9FUSO|nr:beta-galactosidase [Hypnocyclicus thermotrophus]TDT69723.1 beta-galactosidase [Hypnocyclicus thermotrophus]